MGDADLKDPRCNFNLPAIEVVDFNSSQLLERRGFSPSVVSKIRRWKKSASEKRRADIIRLCIAEETQKSYVDTDILFLASNADDFLGEYVGACMWNDKSAVVEMSNSAFCLRPTRLRWLLELAMVFVEKGTEADYFYTFFGSHLLQNNAVLNAAPIRILSQNHPGRYDLYTMVGEARVYGHKQLHLTGAIRGPFKSSGYSYIWLVSKIREELGMSALMFFQAWSAPA